MRFFNICSVLLLISACVPASSRRATRLEGRYTTAAPGKGWSPVAPGGADRAWFNEELGASIYTDSNCGNRYAEARIEDLATELTSGFRHLTMEREEYRTIAEREGILRVHQGTLDGVQVRFGIAVVNRNACNYDFAYISPPQSFEAGWEAFEQVISSFKEQNSK
jgi:hypothetical protein